LRQRDPLRPGGASLSHRSDKAYSDGSTTEAMQ
jgi:hypothetical protein